MNKINTSLSTSALSSKKQLAPSIPIITNHHATDDSTLSLTVDESNAMSTKTAGAEQKHDDAKQAGQATAHKTQRQVSMNPFEMLHTQLNENTKQLADTLQTRRQILAKLTKIYELEEIRKRGDTDSSLSTLSTKTEYATGTGDLPTSNELLLNHSVNLLDIIKYTLQHSDIHEKLVSKASKERVDQLNAEQTLIENICRLENCLGSMREKNMYVPADNVDRLPNLQLSTKVNMQIGHQNQKWVMTHILIHV